MKLLFKNVYKNKKVIVTGHSGFKGSWLVAWLDMLGAKIYGISLYPPSKNYHLKNLNFKRKMNSFKCDIRNKKKIENLIVKIKPDFIFHLAAQSLVRRSYLEPYVTWQTNLIGTINLLESLMILKNQCSVILVTSDKCYENHNPEKGLVENDKLGGEDPYSASKGCAEIAIKSYYKSFLEKNKKIRVVTARAGNVIGGGDWALDRIIPDLMRSWFTNKKLYLRNPKSVRPWQHVLEAVSVYLYLGYLLYKNKKIYGQSFNFGPDNKESNFSVLDLIKNFSNTFKINLGYNLKKTFLEYNYLKINSTKAKNLLKWKPILNFKECCDFTKQWYQNYFICKKNISHFTKKQILEFCKIANKKKINWLK